MKKINISVFTYLLFIIGINTTQAQVIPQDSTEKFFYAETVEVNTSSSKELYERALTWCSSHYKSVRELPRKKRNQNEPLIANAWHDIYLRSELGPYAVQVYYTLTVRIEEGKYEYKVSNIYFKTYADKLSGYAADSFTAEKLFNKKDSFIDGDIKPLTELYLDATNHYFNHLLTDLKLEMNKEEVFATK